MRYRPLAQARKPHSAGLYRENCPYRKVLTLQNALYIVSFVRILRLINYPHCGLEHNDFDGGER